MESLGRLLVRVALTLIALLVVLVVFVVEPVKDPRAGASGVLLVDRGRRARVGDLALCTHGGVATVARIAALPSQRVALRGDRLFVDGEPVERRPCRQGDGASARDLVSGRCFVERRGERAWIVTAPPEGRHVELETTVPAGHVYLLSDDRADLRSDSRGIGPLARQACRTIAATIAPGDVRLRP